MDEIGDIGLLKMDFLGCKTLTLLSDSRVPESGRRGALPDSRLPLDDPETYALFAPGEDRRRVPVRVVGDEGHPAQAEAGPLRGPDRARTRCSARADRLRDDRRLHRAAPRRKLDRIRRAAAPRGSSASPYGVIVYQEQCMADRLGSGRVHARARPILRRAMGTKKRDVMAAQRDKFVAGAKGRRSSSKDRKDLRADGVLRRATGFNDRTATAYALRPPTRPPGSRCTTRAFHGGLLTAEKENTDNIVKYIAPAAPWRSRCCRPISTAPSIDFTEEERRLRFGLGAVKNVGETR
jgi:DNA polymerase-3 subunit alpha